MLFLCEASFQNPFLHMSMLILLEIHIKDYIGHSFHMKSSYIIELFVEQSDVKFSGLL